MEESISDVDVPLKLPRTSSPLFRVVDGIGVIDLIDNPDFPELRGPRELIFLVLMVTVKDRGSAIHFEPYHEDLSGKSTRFLRMFYEIDGELLELVPLPWHVWPSMLREFEAMTGLISSRHRLASWIRLLASKLDRQPLPCREGRFLLRAGDETIEVKLVAWPSARGERIFLTLDPFTASLSERVRAEMKRLDVLIEGETSNYLSNPANHPTMKRPVGLLEVETQDHSQELNANADAEPSTSGEATS